MAADDVLSIVGGSGIHGELLEDRLGRMFNQKNSLGFQGGFARFNKHGELIRIGTLSLGHLAI